MRSPSDTKVQLCFHNSGEYFALITAALGANAFQIRQQIASTCSVVNHRAHVTLSSSDSNNFDLTNPVGLSNFPILTQLSRRTAALFWLISPSVTRAVSHPDESWLRWQRERMNATVVSKLPNILKHILLRRRRRSQGKQGTFFWQPSSKTIFSLRQGRRGATSVRWSEVLQPGDEWMQFPSERDCILMMSVSFSAHNLFEQSYRRHHGNCSMQQSRVMCLNWQSAHHFSWERFRSS